ncbi:MAG: oligosaccharide flippase family protein [Gemmatimonadales bacterium]
MLRFLRERLGSTVLPFSALAIADMAGKLLAFLTIPMITRRFGDGGFGNLGVATQMMLFAVLVGTCGLDVYSVRTVARQPKAIGRWASTVILLRLSLGAVAYAVLMTLAFLVPQYRPVALLIAVFGLSLFTRALYLDWAAQALRATRVLATAMFSIQLLYFGLVALAITTGVSIWGIALAQITAEALTAAGLFYWFHHHAAAFERPLPLREWPSVLKQSSPFAGSQILRGASLGLDLVLLSLFVVPSAEIGWLSAALKIFQLCSGTAAVYFLILLPRLSRSAATGAEAMLQELSHSFRVIVPFAVAAAIGVGFFARPVLQLIGGSARFGAAALALQVLLAAVVVGLINGHYRNALFALGRQHADLRNVMASSVVHLALKAALIPGLGILGIAVGTLGGELVLTGLGAHTLRRAVRTNPAFVTPGDAPVPPIIAGVDHDPI